MITEQYLMCPRQVTSYNSLNF